jgi:hypothetical protein
MEILAVAAIVGIGAYTLGKRRERRRIENGYFTFHDNGQTGPQYANFHYGTTGGYQGGDYHRHRRQPHGEYRRHYTTPGHIAVMAT